MLMHYLLKAYINAKHAETPYCSCPNCLNGIEKKSQNHVFCKIDCKDTFWTKIKGILPEVKWSRVSKSPVYPGGYDQWKKDLEKAEGDIAESILLEEDDDECINVDINS